MARDYGTTPSELVGISTRSVAGMLLNAEAWTAGKIREEENRAKANQERDVPTKRASSNRFGGR